MTQPIANIEEDIVQEFSLFDDDMMKYEYIIDMGKRLPDLDDQYKTEESIVKGCQSTVWLHSWMEDGRVHFQADSNTIITKGIIGLLVRVLSGQKPEAIIQADLNFIDRINLRGHLSEQRSNGLTSMVKRMKMDAATLKAKQKEEA